MAAFVSQTPMDLSHVGTALDLTGWGVTFSEEFDDGISVICNAATSNVNGRLFAPGDSTYGNGCNVQIPPTNTTVYNVANGDLNLKCYYTGSAWQGGMVQTMGPTAASGGTNVSGRGFSAPRGYFAVRHSLMQKYGWCGPWVYSDFHELDFTKPRVELDAVENYAVATPGTNDGYGAHCTGLVHTPSSAQTQSTIQTKSYTADLRRMPNLYIPNIQDGLKREYGILIDDSYIYWYCNRREMCRLPMFDEAAASSFLLRMSMSLFNTPASPTTGQVACSVAVDWMRHYTPAKKWINGHKLISAMAWREGLQSALPTGHAYALAPPLRDVPGPVVLNRLTLQDTYIEEFTPAGRAVGGFLFDLNAGSTISVSSPSGIVGVGSDSRSLVATSTAADSSVQTTSREAITITENNPAAHNSGRQTVVSLQLRPHPVTTLCTPNAAYHSLTTAPSSTFKAALKAFIDNGRDNGWWDKVWLFHCFGVPLPLTQADALINIKGTNHGRNTDGNWGAGTSGSPAFTSGTGVKGNGTSSYVDLGYRMGSGTIPYGTSGSTRDAFDVDNHAMVYHPTGEASHKESCASFGSDYFWLSVMDTSGKLSFNDNTNGSIASVSNSDASGAFHMERTDANNVAVYSTTTGGVFTGLRASSASAAATWQSTTANPIRGCARKGGGDQYGTRQTGCFSLGYSMGQTLAGVYGQAVAALMTACAAG